MHRRSTESTRYLCAAVQLDEKFCDQVLEEIFEENHKAIGVCHGVDLPAVLKSCLLARRRRRERDFPLAALFSGALLFSPLLFVGVPISLILYAVAWRIVFVDLRTTRYEIVGKHLLKGRFNPNFFDFEVSPNTTLKLDEIAETQDANAIIYSGFSPFVGAGINIGGWSFSIDTSKGKKDMGNAMEPKSFGIKELYDYIAESIYKLDLSNLVIEDNLHVNGQEIRDREEFLPNAFMRPVTRLSDDYINHFIENPTYFARHYRCIRVSDWQGELILSIFIRFSRSGQNLFTEANYYLLSPLNKYYRQFDQLKPEPSSDDIRRMALETAFTTFTTCTNSLASIFKNLGNSRQKNKERKEKEKEIESNYAFNYGAATSLRERVSHTNKYHRYFQSLDKEMYLKSIEGRIVDGLSKFLDSKNIDTSDLKETKSTILNHGVMVSGGSIQAQNLTVGEQAKSIFNTLGNSGGSSEGGSTPSV